MNILRKIAVSLCAALLSAALFGTAWSHVAVATIRNKDTVKGWFDKSGFYDTITDVVLQKVNDEQKPNDVGKDSNIPINDPQIQAIAKNILTPDFLKKNVETLLDGSYDWLNGDTPKLDFSIDLTSVKQQLATGLGDYAKTRVDSLPVCSGGEPSGDFDAFNATCRPAGVTGASAGTTVANDILNGDFLKDSVLTASDIKVKDANGNEISLDQSRQGDAIKKSYRLGGYIPLFFAISALVLALGVVFISRDHIAGLRRVGWIVAVTGGVLLITFIIIALVSRALDARITDNASLTTAQRELLSNIIEVVANDVNRVLGLYAGGYLVGGIGMIIGGSIWAKKRSGTHKTGEQPLGEPELPKPQQSVEDKPAEDKEKPEKDDSKK